ncbi:MAG: dUTP diphosphatase [Parcubacteria group bacterium]|nr:MAG: dUTP diphosphatase [Parcubacteria group bacterium]
MEIKIKKLDNRATMPQAMHPGDAGFDVSSLDDVLLPAGQRTVLKTGVAIAIPEGYWGNVRDRSGLAVKHGLHTLAGVVDSNYRGELVVAMINLSDEDYQIKAGDRIAQLIIEKHESPVFAETKELDQTVRGAGREGSSGY